MQTNKQWQGWLRRMGPAIAVLLLGLTLTILTDRFLTVSNLLNVFRQVSINAIIASGMTLVILTGGIDLSVGSVLALSAAITASVVASGLSTPVAILAGLAVGAVVGLINGIIVSRGRVAPFVATLATMTIARGLTLVYTDGRPITGITPSLRAIGRPERWRLDW